MLEEPANEFMCIERHYLGLRTLCRLITEGDLVIVDGNDPTVCNGAPMDIACQVVEDLVRALDSRLAIDQPILMPYRCRQLKMGQLTANHIGEYTAKDFR